MIRERRPLIIQHTNGPYPGLRQIIGVVTPTGVEFFHTGQVRPFGPSGNGDTLNQVQLWPDGRVALLMRLKSDDKSVMFREQEQK